jgi:pilus assembly protein CpaE
MPAPIDADNLNDTIQRVGQMIPAPSIPTPTPTAPTGGGDNNNNGRVLAVFSTKGGSGKSVTATNMAVTLARESSQPVVLLDGHLQFGDVSVMLKLQPQHSVMDAIGRLDSLDSAMIQSLLTVHEPTGLFVLPAPLEPTFADRVTGEQVAALVECLRQFAGHVVIDLPAIFNEVVLSIIEASDDIMLVAELDVPNIKNVKIGLSTLELLNIPKDRLHLVLNRANSKVKLNVAEVERTLGVAAVARVPSDVVVPISVNKGSPVVLSSPKSGVAKAFENLALQFLDNGSVGAAAANGLRRFFG